MLKISKKIINYLKNKNYYKNNKVSVDERNKIYKGNERKKEKNYVSITSILIELFFNLILNFSLFLIKKRFFFIYFVQNKIKMSFFKQVII